MTGTRGPKPGRMREQERQGVLSIGPRLGGASRLTGAKAKMVTDTVLVALGQKQKIDPKAVAKRLGLNPQFVLTTAVYYMREALRASGNPQKQSVWDFIEGGKPGAGGKK